MGACRHRLVTFRLGEIVIPQCSEVQEEAVVVDGIAAINQGLHLECVQGPGHPVLCSDARCECERHTGDGSGRR